MYRAEDWEDQTPFCDLRTLSSCSLGQAAVLCCYKDKRILGLGCVIKNDLNICEYKLTERMKAFSRPARTVKSEHGQRSKLKSKATLVACAEAGRRWAGVDL